MKQKKKIWGIGIVLCLAMMFSVLWQPMSVQAATNGMTYYRSWNRVIDMNNKLVEEVILHEGETLLFTIGTELEDGTYEALGQNYSFSGEEWRITTWTDDYSGISGLDEDCVE